jgi:hypothetical protein
MPNYVSNKVTITGVHDKITEFRNTMNTPNEEGKVVEFSFGKTIPKPKEEEDDVWYDRNWGCKWDAGDPVVQCNDDHKIILLFETPWYPPTLWAKNVAKQFDLKVVIKYDEPDYIGKIVATSTECTREEKEKFAESEEDE